ncbi:MAG: hypothetical protein JST38_03005, partial [Bacteroidetes bacterium]|nr:hypothetical protein [Bacteroidota bacterium]
YMSSAALGGTTRMRVRLDNTINGPNPDPCGNSTFGQVEDYTLNVTPPPCAPPVATTSIIPDCGNFQFSVDVNVTSLGDGASVTVTDNQGNPAQTGGLGTYSFGPYFNGTNVTYQISFGPEPLCDSYVSTTYACNPPNQDCASATALTVSPQGQCNTVNGSTIGAALEPMTGSGCINNAISLPAVYYSFVATGFAHYVHVAGINTATVFNASVYDGCNGNELSCEFDPDSTLVSGLVAGNTYIIRVVSLDGANFEVCVTESGIVPLANDTCSNAAAVAIAPYGNCTPTTGTLIGATGSPQANPACVNQSLGLIDVYYSFVANGTRQIISMAQDSTNLVYFISAYDACGGTELLCALVGPGFDAPGTEYSLAGLTPGNTYYIRVASRSADGGTFSLCVMDPPPPTQVQCGGALVDESYCMTGVEDHQWAYHSNGTGAFTLTFNSGLIDDFTYHQLIVYDGPDANSPILFQNETFPNDPTDLTGITVTATGQDLFMTLVTDGVYLYNPCFSWTVQCSYHPDLPCNANPIACDQNYPGLTTGLGHNLPAGACPFNGAASTGGTEWFVYTATSDQAVSLSTCGTADFDTRISVFSGADCSNLSCLALNDDYQGCSGGSSQVTFNTINGNSYWIAVMGAGAAEGSYTLSVICSPICTPPANDVCADAITLSNNVADGTGLPATYTTTCATGDGPTTCSGTLPVQGVWFTFNSGNYTHALLTLVDNGDNATYTATTLDYARFTGACASIGATGNAGCATDASGLNVMNVTPNTEYRLLVYNTGGTGVAGTFGMMVEHPALNDAAITAIINPAAGLLCGSSMAPQVTLLNNGDNNLTSVQITYGLSGGASHVYNWTGNLAYGQSVNITLPTVPAETGLGQTLTVASSLPNGVADDIPANDSQGVLLDVGGEAVVVNIMTDNDASGLSWQIYDEAFNVVAQNGTMGNNTLVSEYHCLSTTNGNCFQLYITDAFGDGLCCANGNGYWELRTPTGGLLLRDLFDASVDGFSSPTGTPATPSYGFGHSFCLPAGPGYILPTECGIFTNAPGNKVYCNKVTGATQYQFEFSNPDAGFIRRIVRTTTYVHFWDMVANPLVPGVHYFARVRTNVAGPVASAHFGNGCETGLAPLVPCSELIPAPNYGHSCNETRAFNPPTNNSFIYATPVPGASQYQFRIFNNSEGYDQVFTRNTYILQLKWNNTVAPPLANGSTYSVLVNVKLGTVWSGFCGQTCTITIDNSTGGGTFASMEQSSFGETTMWPNPVRDGLVNLSIGGLQDVDQNIAVDIQDIYGKQVFAKEFGNSGERFSTILQLPKDIASGVYMVNITV